MNKVIPRGIRLNNPGNVEKSKDKWQGLSPDQPDSRFLKFLTPQDGIRCIARLIIRYQDACTAEDGSKIDTIKEVIARWAPSFENPTSAYAQHVAQGLAIGADDPIDVHDYTTMYGIIVGIISQENGQQPYSKSVIDEGLRRAGVVNRNQSVVKQPEAGHAVGVAVGTVTTVAGIVKNMDYTEQLQSVSTDLREAGKAAPNGHYFIAAGAAISIFVMIMLGVGLIKKWKLRQ